jgi:gas vesicle protein
MLKQQPDPDILLAARRKLGIDPRNIIAIGDTPYDAESAGKAGMATVGLLCGGFSPAKLRAAGCVALYRDPADLLKNYDNSQLAATGTVRIIGGNGHREKSMNSNNTLYFLMGLGIGAAAGIIYAPKSGPETRDFLRSKSKEGAKYAKQTASDVMDLAKQNADELRQTAAETIDSATQNMKERMEA